MHGHRSSGSQNRLLEADASAAVGTGLPSRTMNMWRKHTALPAFADAKPPSRRQVSLRTFVIACASFFTIALALGLGLGLTCASRAENILATSSSSSPAAAFNYSSYYGIPEHLDSVSIDRLVNATELELGTNFTVSNNTQTRDYTFNITQALAAPDGFQKPMILVNNQSPGPLLEANTGDTVRVQVNNLMSNWSITIHWHGINQHGSTWMDGVAGVSQCGIPPGQSFTYEFAVDGQRGTYWWHAHLASQYTDGVYGPIVIHDPTEMVPITDIERILFVGDLYHTYSSVLLTSYLNPTSKWVSYESGVEPVADNIVLNGMNTYDCSVVSSTYPPDPESPFPTKCTGGQLYSTKVRQGQRVRFRLINSSSFLAYWFSIDNHSMEIVELDGVEIEPISARGVYLNIGQRVSVIVTTNQTTGNYYMRATLPQTCFLPYVPYNSTGLESSGYAVRGILSYDTADLGAEPIGTAGNTSNPYGVDNNNARGDVWEGCDDMPFDIPKPMRPLDAVDVSDANMLYFEYMFRQAQDVNRIFINKTAYAPLEDNATLWKALDQNFDPAAANSYNSWNFGLNQQVLLVPDADKGVQIVINSLDAMEHPWHFHGHTVQVVGWGKGLYGTATNGTIWNLSNPMRRDTVTVPAMSHVVLRFTADNPGLWALHCHVAWHMEGGMFLALAERPSDMVKMIQDMDPDTRKLSQSFCRQGDTEDQAYGVNAEYNPS
ncbi:multicopper oxidase-domain-containing protein [Xylariales sp. PMI_506]|nr:multicopper oxidase-domain-containing protein [Xylariales sp. PMI_506]